MLIQPNQPALPTMPAKRPDGALLPMQLEFEQSMTRYQVLFDSIRARRRRVERLKNIDKFAARLRVNIANMWLTLGYLRREAMAAQGLEDQFKPLGDRALSAALEDLRGVFVRGRQDRATVRRGLAAVREAARRETGESAYTVQLMGALALYHGRVVQMLTGEGKTLTGSIAAPLLAWRHKHLHVFTVNDYLAKRDAESRSAIYARCGLTCGAIVQELDQEQRARVYAMPIVYGTPKQITADWLRDQIRLGRLGSAWSARRRMLAGGEGGVLGGGPLVPGLRAAMIDEADAVLIDEGVVPLIIAQIRGPDEMAEAYRHTAGVAARLVTKVDYHVDLKRKRAELTARGRRVAFEMLDKIDEPVFKAPRRAEELIRQALVAKHCYVLGKQYQISDGRVVIVDEFTGRFLADRNWEHGLHQAVEAKEGLEISAERETMARMSFQRFFRSYPVLCGMTGTAADATGEIETVYQRKVTVIPTNRPVIRQTWAARVFGTADAKWRAVAESVAQVHATGRPILVGTRSVQASEELSARLAARGLTHQVLNANFDKDEAMIISRAGEAGSIVVATNMAGRGTDIHLDVVARRAGGLHVLLTEMHGAKRVDRQFIGRAGRQGDPGSSQMFLSLEDELVRLYAKRLRHVMRLVATGPEELSGLARRVALVVFNAAQRNNQLRDRVMRGETMKQDDWMERYLPGL